MIEVVSIRFKDRGKSYSFAPAGLDIKAGDRVIVETAKGLEIADCSQGNHWVEETSVVQPLRQVARIATADDLRIAELNKKREKEAFQICQKKIAEHGLEMKLVDVECNFEGNKTMFFFTADGRVDFRELVKDLAGIFRNRIELRQIGVRDEAKMIGGIGICGRPYCCNQFLEEFQPVSTKMAKVQALSLNPTKISGSCGRLMCCLRYEQEAYEDLVRHVPKQGAFVETIDGYGTAVHVDLLRQTVKVKLDGDKDDTLHLYKANELAAVPGGRPKDGEEPPHVLVYVPPEPEEPEEPEDKWTLPELLISGPSAEQGEETSPEEGKKGERRRRGNRGRGRNKGEKTEAAGAESVEKPVKRPEDGKKADGVRKGEKKPEGKKPVHKKVEAVEKSADGEKTGEGKKRPFDRRRDKVKTVKVEAKAAGQEKKNEGAPKTESAAKADGAPKTEGAAGENGAKREGRRGSYRRGRPHGKPKPRLD
ncbi:MAG: hypothetical protein IK095_02825 [Oscillospiraceae bacterium]|nr:hypothetical protein [Oscillospiraceae bacterium]